MSFLPFRYSSFAVLHASPAGSLRLPSMVLCQLRPVNNSIASSQQWRAVVGGQHTLRMLAFCFLSDRRPRLSKSAVSFTAGATLSLSSADSSKLSHVVARSPLFWFLHFLLRIVAYNVGPETACSIPVCPTRAHGRMVKDPIPAY